MIRPMAGLMFGQQLAEYTAGSAVTPLPQAPSPAQGERLVGRSTSSVAPAAVTADEEGQPQAIVRFHLLLGDLADRVGGAWQSSEVSARSGWPPAVCTSSRSRARFGKAV